MDPLIDQFATLADKEHRSHNALVGNGGIHNSIKRRGIHRLSPACRGVMDGVTAKS
jgi:hypothetical protein